MEKNSYDLEYIFGYAYSVIKTIFLDTKIIDLLLINDFYFISAQPNNKTILFINRSNLSIERIIPNVAFICSTDCLQLFKENIIVNCEKGIAIISTKTMELIQQF